MDIVFLLLVKQIKFVFSDQARHIRRSHGSANTEQSDLQLGTRCPKCGLSFKLPSVYR